MNLRSDGEQKPLPAMAGLTRQSSVFALTFDEFQSTMGTRGKDYGSMNMDEFLKNIWTAEESHAMAGILGSSSVGIGTADGTALQRQGYLTLHRTLSQKKVDEVWRELVCAGSGPAVCGTNGTNASRPQRQPTLGEITLEEFLVKAGVVREEITPAAIASRLVSNGANCIPGTNIFYSDLASPNNGVGLSLSFGQTGRSDANLTTSAIAYSSAPNLAMAPNRTVNNLSSDGLGKGGDMSSVSPVPCIFNEGLRGRKSCSVEKVIERRHRRMIKNRESAARSRARKQAYTMELEAEAAMLKEEQKELLKQQADMVEKHKRKILELIYQTRNPKKACLRRTRSAFW